MIKGDLENAIKILVSDKGIRQELKRKALDLLKKIDIAVLGIDKSTEQDRRTIEEVRKRIEDRIVKLLDDLRLGEGGIVCLYSCQEGEFRLTERNEPYTRVIAPILHYIASKVSRHEIMKFLAYVIIFDGSVSHGEITFTQGGFHVKDKSKRLPLDVYDKLALYIILMAKYDIDIKRIYVLGNSARMYFDKVHAATIFASAWDRLDVLLKWGERWGLWGDHIYKKLRNAEKYVKLYADEIKIIYQLFETPGSNPKVVVEFKDESGANLAHINVRWTGQSLSAKFSGDKEKAEILAALLRAMGADVEAKKYGDTWQVRLSTNKIVAIRRREWVDAMKALVEKLYERNLINDKQRKRLTDDLNTGPNIITISGKEFSVIYSKGDDKRQPQLEIRRVTVSARAYSSLVNALRIAGFERGIHFTAKEPEGIWVIRLRSREILNMAVEALKRNGLEEGRHFTVQEPGDREPGLIFVKGRARDIEKAIETLKSARLIMGKLSKGADFDVSKVDVKPGYVYMKMPAFLWKLAELSRKGISWARNTLDRLKEIATVKGFYDLIKEDLEIANAVETVDPKGMVLPNNVKIVDIHKMWEGGRPRIEVIYEINGDEKAFTIYWGVYKSKRRAVLANVRIRDNTMKTVLDWLTGRVAPVTKSGTATLTSSDLLRMARFKGVGWDLLHWYVKAMAEEEKE